MRENIPHSLGRITTCRIVTARNVEELNRVARVFMNNGHLKRAEDE
uniref:Uncharacterized protein n=1 Tax=viral metagenome TaxID=1070528 RepID=A0A6C0E297_9ZZZZ